MIKANTMQSLMDKAYGRWQGNEGWSTKTFFDHMEPAEKTAVLLGNLNYQVENGGFQQWVGNGYAQNIELLIEALNRFAKWEDIPENALRYVQELLDFLDTIEEFLDLSKKDRGCMGNYLRDNSDEGYAEFQYTVDPMDTRFYEINTCIYEALDNWMAQGGY